MYAEHFVIGDILLQKVIVLLVCSSGMNLFKSVCIYIPAFSESDLSWISYLVMLLI